MRHPASYIQTISSHLQYAVMAEILGRGGHVASEAVNCSAPDTGNMGTIAYSLAAGLFAYVGYRGIGTIWIPGTTEKMARPSAEWRDSFCVCDDREIW
jgi:hypothetical protein